ncbi:hypothetical protein [Arenibacterium halophilum]|uniref:Uncharacterized protein n=1 Tax=Arenibacterium halophilum TaxID=2583821 RepID=A0ABY2XBT7_9RHOB|nr:hypothetical protein [Arenibacterium halophilum]TMV13523.1 hypothetical protein FGK64_12360 [Arenibacterium halophilum]
MTRFLAAALCCVIGSAAAAQEVGFDPSAPCGDSLRATNERDKLMVAAWAMGAIAQDGPVDLDASRAVLERVYTACLDDETVSLATLLLGPEDVEEAAGPIPGSEEDARQLLMGFVEQSGDLKAKTYALKPTAEDVRAVYAEPLATRLIAYYDKMFTPNEELRPNPGQSELRLVYATMGALKAGDDIRWEFPGGYRHVVEHIIGDQPIVAFEFVRPGLDAGLSVDGLIFVNGAWKMMPKPWRTE